MTALRSRIDELARGLAAGILAALANARIAELREIVGGGRALLGRELASRRP